MRYVYQFLAAACLLSASLLQAQCGIPNNPNPRPQVYGQTSPNLCPCGCGCAAPCQCGCTEGRPCTCHR